MSWNDNDQKSGLLMDSNMSTTTYRTELLYGNVSLYFDNASTTSSNHSLYHDYILSNLGLAVLLSTFAFITIFGNSLVIVAVIKERSLRSATNYMIVSLAVADLVVGTIVMPFSIIQIVLEEVWLFGNDWCDLWHSFDVLSATGSILNLCLIAMDRYWAITDPIAYPNKMSHRRVWALISLVWICSCAISFPAILWWRADMPEVYPPNECLFTDNCSYLIISSMVSFYIPLFIMMFVYYRIYRAVTVRNKSLQTTGQIVIKPVGLRGEVLTLRVHRGRSNHSLIGNRQCYSRAMTEEPKDTDSQPSVISSDSTSSHHSRSHSRHIKHRIQKLRIGRKLSRFAKEQKAAKTLGVVMGIFILCWSPFFLTNLIFCMSSTFVSHADVIMAVFTWLGYLNSGMNPIIYSLSMREFKRAFKRILCSNCTLIKNRNRDSNRLNVFTIVK